MNGLTSLVCLLSTIFVTTEGDSCELRETTGSFQSPNFPDADGRYTTCNSWHIVVRPGQKIQLYFKTFELRGDAKVSVYDGATTMSKKLGDFTANHSPPPVINSSKNTLFVTFLSGSYGIGKGFNASYVLKGYCLNDMKCEGEEGHCYTSKQRCDGKWDCPKHGRDEIGCGKCPRFKFECVKGGSQCYEKSDRCNGRGFCDNKADDRNCTSELCGSQFGTFLCQNSQCILENWKCDGRGDCDDHSDEIGCYALASRKVITAAVVGALSCSLLLVIALGCTCRLHAIRMREIMGNNYVSPLSRVEQEIWARRSAPPLYDEAMQTSRPYDEMVAAIEQELANQRDSAAEGSDVELLRDVNIDSNEHSDDDLLDVSEGHHNPPVGECNVQVTLLAGASAQWRRTATNRNKSALPSNLPVAKEELLTIPSRDLYVPCQTSDEEDDIIAANQNNCDAGSCGSYREDCDEGTAEAVTAAEQLGNSWTAEGRDLNCSTSVDEEDDLSVLQVHSSDQMPLL